MNEYTENEEEIRFRKEFEEIIKQSNSSFKPSYEDIVRFHSQKTKLLFHIDCYALPEEGHILEVLNGGEIFKYGYESRLYMTSGKWVMTRDVEVLYIFPPMELTRRLAELEKPVMTVKDVKQVFHKADVTNAVSQEALQKIWQEWGFVTKAKPATEIKKKKPRKKK